METDSHNPRRNSNGCCLSAASRAELKEKNGGNRAKIALTGSIACGKSLLSGYLNELGIETLDADDVAHELIGAEERARLAKIVFKDSAKRKELEARLHPIIKKRLDEWQAARSGNGKIAIAVVPLLFEVGWDKDYDIVCAISASKTRLIERMVKERGYSREEAEARLAAQIPPEEKAARADYTIWNDGSKEDLRSAARKLAELLKQKTGGI